MDQEKMTKTINDNKGILRQLTDLNNRVKKLEKAKEDFVESIGMSKRKGFEVVEGTGVTKKDIPKIKVGGTDPD